MAESEVARIKREIEQAYQAACQGMHGTAQGTSQHRFITAKLERVGELHDQLKELIGDEEADQFVKSTMEGKHAKD